MLIAIEGIDGSGKATQAKLLQSRLTEALDKDLREKPREECDFTGCALFSFPTYDTSVFGPHVKRYLRGDMGPLNANDPFLTSLLYAIDRYENRDSMMHLLDNDTLVICDRYVPSNIAHQCAKEVFQLERRRQLARYIEDTEYRVFRMPEPTLVILLDLTAEQSFRRTHARDDQPDLHQDSLSYMAKVREVYLELADTYTCWHLVKCLMIRGEDRSVEEIHAEIWEIVSAARTKIFNKSPFAP